MFELKEGKKIYFASDFHLGLDAHLSSKEREEKICSWLNQIAKDAQALFLLGDVFDFWFEHKYTIPKGYYRLFYHLHILKNNGCQIFFFKGNHDMWMKDFFIKEFNAQIISHELCFTSNGKNFFLHHGDGLSSKEKKYNFIKSIFRNRFCIRLFSIFHPNFSFAIAQYFSKTSRRKNHHNNAKFCEKTEYLLDFIKNHRSKNNNINYYVFGHRHLPLNIEIDKNCKYINLGDWVKYFTYAQFDGNNLSLKTYE